MSRSKMLRIVSIKYLHQYFHVHLETRLRTVQRSSSPTQRHHSRSRLREAPVVRYSLILLLQVLFLRRSTFDFELSFRLIPICTGSENILIRFA